MNAALSILSFPPEIVIKSLEGLSIQDVVNVAQTCTSLRAIILSNKQSIMQTRNAFAIWQSLPHGSTPATISADLLYATAVASLAISKRLSSNMPLKPRNHVSYDLSLFDLTWNRTSPSHGHPAHFFLANDLLAFRSSSVLFIMKLGLSGAIDESVSLDLTSGNAYWYSVDYQLSDDGRALLVAVLIQNRTVSSRSLQVFEVSVETCGFGSNTLLLSVGVPFVEGSMSIALHDPYVVVSNNHEGLAIIDLRHKKGLTVSLLDRASLPELGGSGHKTMAINQFIVHPFEPAIFAFNHDHPTKVILFDIPDDMPELTHALSPSHESWTSREILPRDTSFILPSEAYPLPLVWVFRKTSPSSYTLDTLAFSHYAPTSLLSLLSQRQPEGDQRARMSESDAAIVFASFHLHQETRQPDVEGLPISFRSPENNASELFGMQMIAPGIYFTERYLHSEQVVRVPKFEDGNGFGSTWTRLNIPQFLDLPWLPGAHLPRDRSALYRGDFSPSIFNVLTGKLYVCRPDGLHVIQY